MPTSDTQIAGEKREYIAPELSRLGDFAQLTAAKGGIAADGASGNSKV